MSASGCIFCKIAAGEMGQPIAKTNDWTAFHDIHPQAPVHVLVIPNTHIENLAKVDDGELLGMLLNGVQSVAKQLNLTDYRVVSNCGLKAGQTVFHLHFHLLGGWEDTPKTELGLG